MENPFSPAEVSAIVANRLLMSLPGRMNIFSCSIRIWRYVRKRTKWEKVCNLDDVYYLCDYIL